MSLVDNLAGQTVPNDPVQQVGAGAVKGLDAGLAYAAAQDNAQKMSDSLQMLKDDHEMKKTSYLLDQLDKAAQTDNKQLRKIHLDGVDATMQKFWGAPLSEPVKQYLASVPESSEAIQLLVRNFPEFAKDPKQNMEFQAGLVSALKAPTLADAQKIMEPFYKVGQEEDVKKALLGLRMQSVQNSTDRVDLMKGKAAYTAIKDSQNATPVRDADTQLLGADKGLNIIRKGLDNYAKTGETITWSQLHEVTSDLAGLTTAKLSAVVPVARQEGIEKDIPKAAQALAVLDRESKQSPSASVPVGLLRSMKGQFESLQKVISVYRGLQLNKRLDAGVQSGILPAQTADKFRGGNGVTPPPDQNLPPQGAPVAAATPVTPPPVGGMTPARIQALKAFKAKYPNYDALPAPVKAQVDQKTFDSL